MMNPITTQRAIAPVVGERIASFLCSVARTHKTGVGFTVAVPSYVLVRVAEGLALLTSRDQMAARLTGLQASVRAAIRDGSWKVDGANDPGIYL
jgi:hypothetical protein